MHDDNRWTSPTAGVSFCGIMTVGGPPHVELFGSHLTGDLGVGAVIVGLFAAASVWMFRRWGGQAERPTIPAPENEALWAELETAAPDAEREPTVL